ncbi:MAG: hypothetical protein ACRD8A_12745 [Candidatus Acidiferrales bacterium]
MKLSFGLLCLVLAIAESFMLAGPASAKDKTPPVIPDKNVSDVMAAELQIQAEIIQSNSLQTQLNQLKEQYQASQLALAKAEADACAAAGADCTKDWQIDISSGRPKLVAKPQPARK